MNEPINLLVIEDNPGDARPIKEEFHSEVQGGSLDFGPWKSHNT